MTYSEIVKIWKEVFSNRNYILIFFIISLFFYTFNAILVNWKLLFNFSFEYGLFESFKLFIILVFNFAGTIALSSLISLILISLLFGILVTLIWYKIATQKESKKMSASSSVGIFFAVLAPGCAACGLGLVSALGLGSLSLTFLPYKGLELSALAIMLLSFAIFKTSQDLTTCEICQDNKSNKMGTHKKALQ